MKVSEAMERVEGEVLPDIEGMVTGVFNRSEGEGKFGKWSYQNVELSDGVNSIKVTLKDRDEESKDLAGKEIVISSTLSKKYGLLGVKMGKDKYGKQTVIVTKTAVIAEKDVPDIVEEAKENAKEVALRKSEQAIAWEKAQKEKEETEKRKTDGQKWGCCMHCASRVVSAAMVKGLYSTTSGIELEVERLAKLFYEMGPEEIPF